MENVRDEFDNLSRIIKMIANQFGDNCEVILHDLTGDYEHTIVAIEHGELTGRTVGGCGSNIGLQVLRGTSNGDDMYNYFTKTPDGKLLRSSTIHLRNSSGKVIGAICINFNVTDILNMENQLHSLTMYTPHDEPETHNEYLATDVNKLLDLLISECTTLIDKPTKDWTKEEKIIAIRHLDNKGAFLITKSGDRICKFLNISKYTLYNYLETARNPEPGAANPSDIIS